MDRLRVLTLNIWHRESDWRRRAARIRAGMRQLGPDLVGLQEVLQGPGVDQSRELAEGAYEVAFAAARELDGEPGVGFGNALLSRHPIVHVEALPLPGVEMGERRCVLHAVVETPLGEVPVFVTHLSYKRHQGALRVAQVLALTELVEQRAPRGRGYPPVVMGDFNAVPESDEIRFMGGLATLAGRSVYFADAHTYAQSPGPGYTVDGRNPHAARSHAPPRRIDYIFVGGTDKSLRGEPRTARVVFDQPTDAGWASDHFGVYAELSV